MVEGKESEQLVRDLLVDADHDPHPLLNQLNEDFVNHVIRNRELDILCFCETKRSPPLLDEEGTCEWLLRNENYTEWISRERELLWVMGVPGSGKSTIMEYLYQHLQKLPVTEHDLRLDFFFHRRGTGLQKTMIGMLRSLLYQLYKEDSSVREPILNAFRERQLFGEAGKTWQWQISKLEELLSNAVISAASSRPLLIFVDALDEAGEDGAREVVSFFHRLNDRLARSNGTVKICISCRHYPVVATVPGLHVCVEDHNSKDILSFVREKLGTNIQVGTLSTESLQILEKHIVDKASPVFQWASLVLPLVSQKANDGESFEDIMAMLAEVPKGLDEVYEHILTSVIKPQHRVKSLHLMQWICLAERPLSPTELRHAIACDDAYIHPSRLKCSDAKGFVESDSRMEILTKSLSGGLAEVKHHEQGNTVQFVHQSVNDFLLNTGLGFLMSFSPEASNQPLNPSPDLVIGISQHRLSRSCINYLRLDEVILAESKDEYTFCAEESKDEYMFRTEENKDEYLFRTENKFRDKLRHELPFIDYAAASCFVHAGKAESHEISQEYLAQVFGSASGKIFKSWIEICDVLRLWYYNVKVPEKGSTLLHIASTHNLQSTVRVLLENDTNIEAEDVFGNRPLHFASQWGFGKLVDMFLGAKAEIGAKRNDQNTALQLAAANGHEEIVKRLLRYGADVNESTGETGNALQAAAYKGSKMLVQILLNNGAEVNAQGGAYGNALQAASATGQDAVVQLLLEKDAKVNVQGGNYGSALQAAIYNRHRGIVQLLLKKGADVNAQRGKYGNALQTASGAGDKAIVQLLLKEGAEVNAQGDYYYGNALQAASVAGDKAIVQLLLKEGAEVNAQGGYYGNALQAASYSGNKAVVQQLLEKGARVNAQGGEHGNALQAASYKGNKEMVQLLLEQGAKVNAQGGYCGNALQAAITEGHEELVPLLLQEGAEVNAQGGYYGNALQAALCNGSKEVVLLLLEEGAEVNAQGGLYGNALQAASSKGNKEMVRLLLEQGAKVNAQGGKYSNALQATLYSGNKAVVQLLLKEGAEVNLQGGEYGNALQAASYRGDKVVVQLLLENGAKVNAQGGKYGNALQAASLSYRNIEVVRLLLEKGAEVNAQGGEYGNALQAASSSNRNIEVVRILLEKGAEVNAQGGEYGNALQAASFWKQNAIVQLLLEKGAGVNA
ncbi:MAG: hypothetical protein M1819_005558 [Sarea resinae]|nr:MAG: hypothetical protein M1819_005558 [Sarea resinae]